MQAGAVNIKLMADITDLQGKMQQAGKSVGGATSSMEKSVDTLKRTFAGLAGAFSIGFITKQVLEAQRSFDKLNAGLITATGSTENAAQAFKALQAFAATTPFSLEEATTAFIKMRNMGLDPSERALRSYGNTSAAMGKSLEQMIEAVADAATGEFERLKEFGIKAKVEGDKVALTFQGNTTSIGNSSKEIEQYLQRIGEVEFGGGMALRAATLDGAISNLGDTWQQVMLTIAQSGFGGDARQGVLDLSNALTDLGSIIETINASYEKSSAAGEEMGVIHKALTTIFEAVAVFGVNLAYVLDRMGNTLGGLAAQAAAAATLDFAAVSAIQKMIIEDDIKARKEVDARTAAILGASEKTRAAAKAEAEDKAKTGRDDLARYKLDIAAKNEVSKADQALIKTAEDFLQGLKNEAAEAGLTADQIKLLAAARAAALSPTAELGRAINDQAVITIAANKAAKDAVDIAKTQLDANNALIDAEYKRISQYEETLKATAEANQAIRDETELLGLSDSAQLAVTQARELVIITLKEEQLARLENSQIMSREQIALEEEIRLLKERQGLTQKRGTKNIAVDQAKAAAAEWKRTTDDIERGLTDSLFRAFEAGKGFFQTLWDGIKNLFKTTVLTMLIKPVVGGITGMFGMAGSAAAADGGSSLTSSLGIVDTVSKVYSAITGSFAALGDSVAFAAQDIGAWLVTNTTGTLNSFGSSLMGGSGGLGTVASGLAAAAAGIAIGSLIAGDKVVLGMDGTTTSAIGTAIGYAVGGPLGAVIGGALGGLANAVFGMGPQNTVASGISGNYGANGASGLQGYQSWQQDGGWFRSDKSGTNNSALDAGTTTAINDAVTAASNSVRAYAAIIGMSADAVNGFTQAINISLMGLSAEDAEKAIIKSVADFADAMATSAYGAALAAYQLAGETITATLTRLGTDLTTVNQVFSTMGETLMAASIAGADAASKLVAMMGGAEAFTASTSAYYAAFYSETERVGNATRQLTEVLTAMGIAMPDTRDSFRAVVDAQDLMTEAGRATYAVLIALAPAFDQVTTATDAFAKTAADTATALAKAASDTAAAAIQAGIDTAQAAVTNAMSALSRAVDAERNSITTAYEAQSAAVQSSLDVVSASVSKLQSLSSVLRSTLDGMSIAGAESASRSSAQATIAAALAQARLGGGLPLDGELDNALRIVAQPSEQLYASFEDYAKDFYQTANNIAALAEMTDVALTADQVRQRQMTDQLALLAQNHTAEMTRLDSIISTAQMQIDAVNNVNTSVITVAQAIANLGTAINGLAAANAAATAAAAAAAASTAPAAATGWSGNQDTLMSEVASYGQQYGGDAYYFIAGVNDAAAKLEAAAMAASALGMTAAGALEYTTGHSLAYWTEAQRQFDAGLAPTTSSIKGFAVGTNNVPFDMQANIHKGERIIPAADNRELMARLSNPQGSAEMLAELRALRSEVQGLRIEAQATASHTNKTARLLDRAMPTGTAIATVAEVTA